jgi:hypothetical protein
VIAIQRVRNSLYPILLIIAGLDKPTTPSDLETRIAILRKKGLGYGGTSLLIM